MLESKCISYQLLIFTHIFCKHQMSLANLQLRSQQKNEEK